MNKTAFLIVGANFINKGAEAMLKTVAHEIKKRHTDPVIYCICHSGEKDIASQQGFIPLYVERTFIGNLVFKIKNKLQRILSGRPVPFADYSPMDKISRIESLRMAIDVSGFAYGDKRGYLQPLETIKIIQHCKKVGAKYIFMPQAWGSFEKPDVAENCRNMLQMADHFFARDDVSRKYLAELLQKPITEIALLPDIAFHFPIPTIDGKKLLKNAGYNGGNGRKILMISPNMRVYERSTGKGKDNSYVQLLTRIITYATRNFDVVLVPNEILPPGMQGNDDQYLCKLLYDALETKDNCYYLNGYYSAEEIKAVIREAHILLASRFHSLVFALSLGIPSIAISWAHKYRELFKLFGMEHFVIEDSQMHETGITERLNELIAEHERWAKQITDTLPQLKQRNATVFELLK